MRRVLVPDRISGEPLQGGALVELHGLSMGTSWRVKLVAERPQSPEALQAGIQAQLDAVVAQMSHWEAPSDLCRFNRAAAGTWHILPRGFYQVLSCALAVAAESDGAYDPAAGALVDLWGFGPDGAHACPGFVVPDVAAIAAMRGTPGWSQIELDAVRSRALQPGGAQLDFSAVAKGFAVDQMARHLESKGIRHYLVEAGGELRGAGMKPDGEPWWVMLENPPDVEVDEVLVALHSLAIATSGDYRRYFVADGRAYSHTLDPRTGYPVANGVASVTVVAPDCMMADAWSTALTVMGVEQGLRCADEKQLAARFLVRGADGSIRETLSQRFQDLLQ
jgi:thiamine biosynthesis lipoprotein